MRAPLFGQLILASSVILASLSGVVSAQTEQQSFSVRVQVSVEADNETVKSKVVSYVNRELRSLSDVVITDTGPQYRLDILVLEGTFVPGTPTGVIALSTVLMKPLKETFRGQALKVLLENKGSEWFFEYLKDQNLFISHWVQTGGTKDLRSLCEELVAVVDSKYFEAARTDWQTSQDELSKEKQ